MSCLALLVCLACGGIDNNPSDLASTDGDITDRRVQELEFELARRGENQKLPFLLCEGHFVSKKDPNVILTELTAFAENEVNRLIVLPGFKQNASDDAKYIVTRYTPQEMREKCERGLNAYFAFLATNYSDIFDAESETLLQDYELSKQPSLLTMFVRMPNKQTYEVSAR